MTTPATTISQVPAAPVTIKSFFAQDNVKAKFQEMLGKRAPQFITSVLQIVNSSTSLATADPASIYNAAATAATLDLPINNNLGFAYIISYKQKQKDDTYKEVAAFQMGYKGFIQLAQRSGQFATINSTDVREGEIKSHNRLTGEIQFEWLSFAERLKAKQIGFVAYFKLLNGFEKSFFMSVDELNAHGKKYSKTFTFNNSLWKTDFDGMATKTVVKLLLAKFGPLSIEMQRAVTSDQAVINDVETQDVTYVDSVQTEESQESVVVEKKEALKGQAKIDMP